MKVPKEAAPYYSQLISNYPLSTQADAAKERLTAMHEPIPHPTRATLARARADQTHRTRLDPLAMVGGMLSSSPDYSATRHGPVHLGAKPGGTEVAKAPVTVTGGNAVAVEQVSDKSLEAAKPAESKPEGTDPVEKAAPAPADKDKTPEAQDSSSKPAQDVSAKTDSKSSSDTTAPAKKKGRFHLLKKVVKPF